MNEVIKNIKARRSCREYIDTQISTEDLNEILECALCGPSGMNSQGCYYTAIQNKEVLQELNKAVKAVFREREESSNKKKSDDNSTDEKSSSSKNSMKSEDNEE